MSQRPKSSKYAPSGQRMRSSQSSKPRHVPNVSGLFPRGTSYSMEQDSPFAEPSYALHSTQPQHSSQGHMQESLWTHTGHTNPPGGNASILYSNGQGGFSQSYDASMTGSRLSSASYTASLENSAIFSTPLSWTPCDVATSGFSSLSEPMECDFDMNSENAFFQGSSGSEYLGLTAEVPFLPGNQSSDSMSSAHSFISNSPYFCGNLPAGTPSIANNCHVLQRVAVDNHLHTWAHGHRNAGLAQHMPLTPPASDHGTPPNTQECSFLSSQDSGQDAYIQDRFQPSQEGTRISHSAYATTDVTSRHQMQSTVSKKTTLAQRPIRSASDRKGSHDSQDPLTHQPEGTHNTDTQPRSHHLYQAAKGEDGLWRCPFRDETKCNHEPTPQKCCYDKYLDSHIKPFVCTFQDCGSPNFSSNACLFRHQREAHGLHGHGENPHLCHFAGCDRSLIGNGFPRKWNLKDHMKRVHGWEESGDSPSSGSPPAVFHRSGQTVRKRKGSPPMASVAMKRQSSSQAKARTASVAPYQYTQPLDQVGDQNYSAKQVMAYPMEFCLPGQDAFNAMPQSQYVQTNGYPRQFGQSREYYNHEAEGIF